MIKSTTTRAMCEASVVATEPRLRHDVFVADVRGVSLAFEVYHLHEQLFAYVGGVDGRFADCAFAAKARTTGGSGGVAATTLLGTEVSARASTDCARRLALRSGKSIVASVNLPAGAEALQDEAEKILIRHLRETHAIEGDVRELERALGAM